MLTGKKAEETCQQILDAGMNDRNEWREPYMLGYFTIEGIWLAFDNTTKEFWLEEFSTEKEAKQWCES